MANTIKCKDCKKYFPLERPRRSKKGGVISLKRGHCLYRTVYARNKPGNPVYPPGAIVREMPYGQHHIHIVEEDQVVPHCTAVDKR